MRILAKGNSISLDFLNIEALLIFQKTLMSGTPAVERAKSLKKFNKLHKGLGLDGFLHRSSIRKCSKILESSPLRTIASMIVKRLVVVRPDVAAGHRGLLGRHTPGFVRGFSLGTPTCPARPS